jgi:hypothetical protein
MESDAILENSDPFIGIMLKQRYILVQKFNSEGANGSLYIAKDTF